MRKYHALGASVTCTTATSYPLLSAIKPNHITAVACQMNRCSFAASQTQPPWKNWARAPPESAARWAQTKPQDPHQRVAMNSDSLATINQNIPLRGTPPCVATRDFAAACAGVETTSRSLCSNAAHGPMSQMSGANAHSHQLLRGLSGR